MEDNHSYMTLTKRKTAYTRDRGSDHDTESNIYTDKGGLDSERKRIIEVL